MTLSLQAFGGGTSDLIFDPSNGGALSPNAPYTIIDAATMLPATEVHDESGSIVTQLVSDADGRYAGSAMLQGAQFYLRSVGTSGKTYDWGPLVSTKAVADVIELGSQLDSIAASAAASAFSAKQAQAAAEAVQTGAATTNASLLTSGTVDPARLPALPASQIGSGTIDPARLPDLSTSYARAADLAPINGISTATVNTYVDAALGSDTNVGTLAKPFKTIQRAFDAMPKIINRDHYVNIAPGTYDEEAALKGISGAAVVVQMNGTPPADSSISSGVKVKALAFYDINGRVVLQNMDMVNSDTVVLRSCVLFSRVSYASCSSNRFTGSSKTNGTGIPSVQFDGSGGSVNSNYFSNQYMCVQSLNGSRVRVDSTNVMGTSCTFGLNADAATIFKNGTTAWAATATTPESVVRGGGINYDTWQDWTPTFSATGSMTYTGTTVSFARYTVIGRTVHFALRVAGTTGGTASTSLQFTLPVPGYLNQNAAIGNVVINDGGFNAGWAIVASSTLVQVRQLGLNTNWGIGADRRFYINGAYELA